MKEATGEASMTGITIAIIAVVAVVAVPIVRMVVNNVQNNACCASMGGDMKAGVCTDKDGKAIDNYLNQCKENNND